MTKHFLPDELIFKADYIRLGDGAIMRDDGAGGFVRVEGTGTPIEPILQDIDRNRTVSRKRLFCDAYTQPVCVPPPVDPFDPRYPDKFTLWYGSEHRDFVLKPRPRPIGIALQKWRVNDVADVASQVIDDTEAAALNRAKIADYDAKYPTNKFPEHKIFGRASRNASPQYDEETLKSLGEYIDLHGSGEPMQSVFTAGTRVLEMEMRPSPEEMESLWNVPTVQYETRRVRTSDMRLSEDGYLCNPISAYREMKVPAGGDVEYWVKSPKKLLSADKLRRRLRSQGIDEQEIDSEIEQRSRLERVSFQDKGKGAVVCSIGTMQFAPLQHFKSGRIVYIGQLTDYGAYAAQDKLVQPQELECPGSDKKFWAPLVPRELSNKALPYNVDSEDELQFDNHSEPPPYIEPHDDNNPHVILERKQVRDAYDRLLAPQTLLVMDSLLLDLAKNRTQIGRATSDDQTLGEKTYEKRGKKAVDAALEDIRKARQILEAMACRCLPQRN